MVFHPHAGIRYVAWNFLPDLWNFKISNGIISDIKYLRLVKNNFILQNKLYVKKHFDI